MKAESLSSDDGNFDSQFVEGVYRWSKRRLGLRTIMEVLGKDCVEERLTWTCCKDVWFECCRRGSSHEQKYQKWWDWSDEIRHCSDLVCFLLWIGNQVLLPDFFHSKLRWVGIVFLVEKQILPGVRFVRGSSIVKWESHLTSIRQMSQIFIGTRNMRT